MSILVKDIFSMWFAILLVFVWSRRESLFPEGLKVNCTSVDTSLWLLTLFCYYLLFNQSITIMFLSISLLYFSFMYVCIRLFVIVYVISFLTYCHWGFCILFQYALTFLALWESLLPWTQCATHRRRFYLWILQMLHDPCSLLFCVLFL